MARITEDYVSFETSKLLREKGFKEPTLAYAYSQDTVSYYSQPKVTDDYKVEAGLYPLPTLQMAMKWLRIEHNIHIESLCPIVDSTDEPVTYNVVISDLRNYCLAFDTPLEDKEFDSYEQACEAGIEYCLENLI